jgi:hypothetical protein
MHVLISWVISKESSCQEQMDVLREISAAWGKLIVEYVEIIDGNVTIGEGMDMQETSKCLLKLVFRNTVAEIDLVLWN